MEQGSPCCPVCTLYLREGITLQAHLETHPKDKVIEALLRVTSCGESGQTAPSQSISGSASSDTLVPAQQCLSSNTGFMTQSQNYVNPQTQVTAAVTYQQFVTSNGSTVIPQYIQVPTIVGPNGTAPVVPYQPLSFVPNHAHTMYNPLYNPYIPQPYPFVQPFYSSTPVTSEQNTQVSSSQVTNSVTFSSNTQADTAGSSDTVAKQVSSVATNTASSTKNSVVKFKTKTLPMKSATQAKFRIIKNTGSRLKGATSTMTAVAAKSFRNTSISKIYPIAKTSVITRMKSFKTKNRPLLPKPNNTSAAAKIILQTPSPPPLTKAPCLASHATNSVELPCYVKSENESRGLEVESRPVEAEKRIGNEDNDDLYEVEDRTVIVESNNVISVGESVAIKSPASHKDEETVNLEGESMLPVITAVHGSSEILNREWSAKDALCVNLETERQSLKNKGWNSGDDDDDDDDEDDLQDKMFNSLDFDGGAKVELKFPKNNGIMPQETFPDRTKKIPVFDQEANKQFSEENERPLVLSDTKMVDNALLTSQSGVPRSCSRSSSRCSSNSSDNNININHDNFDDNNKNNSNNNDSVNSSSSSSSSSNSSSYSNSYNRNVICCDLKEENPAWKATLYAVTTSSERQSPRGETRAFADMKSVTYTDLQPATNSKILQDLGITTSFDLNNYMEVDGIKIYFNNANVRNIPLEPIIKFTSTMKADMAKAQNMKLDKEARENNPVVESVIHVVSGTGQKNDFSGEACTNNEAHMNIRDLSPLTLNIRADESMPARGELSEQESLGAENSNWGLFHSEVGSMKTQNVAVEGEEDPNNLKCEGTTKSFKCPHCPEIFSSLKDRRLHRNSAHEKAQSGIPRKTKTFACTHCKEKFTSLKDRRQHIVQNHFYDAKKITKIKQEGEGRDENILLNNCDGINESDVTVKLERDEATVKCETNLEGQCNRSPCEVTKNCPGCDLQFTGAKKLREHLKKVHGVSRYKCGICLETFDTQRDYNSHLRIHPLECNQCGKIFNRKPNLILHLRRHLVVKPYMCTQCPKSFITRQKLEEHLNGHSGKKPLKCSLCDSTFSRHSNLIQHRNIHHAYGKKKVKDFVCRCGEVFHSLRKLEWHKEVHDTKPKTCPFCSQKFIHINSVTRHVRRAHMPHYLPSDKKANENVQCPICGKIYLRSSLMVHMRVHNGERPFVCQICNKSFTTKWNLELHNWTHQSRNNMPFKCTTCKSAFFREVDYVAHLNSHRNYKPFTCNVCGQKFIRKYNCLRHQEEHKKEKKFVCTVTGCEKSFHRSYYLKDHMRVHTGVRPYTCHVCGKASSTKSNHNKHVRIHDTREPLNTEN